MGKIEGGQGKTATLNAPGIPQATGEGLRRDVAAQGEVIKSIEGAEKTLEHIRDAQEINAANVYATEQMTSLRDKAAQDTDLKSESRYLNELEKIGSDASKNIGSQIARDDFVAKYRIASSSTASAIRNNFRDKQIKAAKADFLTNINALQDSYLNAMYPQEKSTSAALIKQTIDDNVRRGVIDSDDGAKIWIEVSKNLPIKDAMRDIGINPSTALVRLQENSYGIKDEDKRADLIADAQRAVLRENKMLQLGLAQDKEQKAVDLTSKLWDGSLTLTEIQNEMNSGDLDRKDAEHLRKALISDKVEEIQQLNGEKKDKAEVEQATTYMAMWDMILKKGKAVDKRRKLLQVYSDGKLSKDDAKKLYTGYLIPAQGGGKVSLAEEVAAEESPKNHFIAGAIRMFRKFWDQGDLGGEGETE